jgi:hypothetical protein
VRIDCCSCCSFCSSSCRSCCSRYLSTHLIARTRHHALAFERGRPHREDRGFGGVNLQ